MKATENRVALISDASTGAAEAVAKRLEQDGTRVLRNYPEGVPGGSLVHESRLSSTITGASTDCSTCPTSAPALSGCTCSTPHPDSDCSAFPTTSLASVQALSQWVLDRAGRLDYLIHTDNFIFRATVEEIAEEDFANCVNRNAKSAFLCTKVLGEAIATSNGGKGGSVVYLSSLHDEKPTGSAFAYSCGRGAVKMLCREMALFMGRKGVRCNQVEMDVTEETVDALDSLAIPFNYDAGSKVPLKRMTQTQDFSGAVAFLVSEDAAHVNGTDIRVDGGHLLHYIDR